MVVRLQKYLQPLTTTSRILHPKFEEALIILDFKGASSFIVDIYHFNLFK